MEVDNELLLTADVHTTGRAFAIQHIRWQVELRFNTFEQVATTLNHRVSSFSVFLHSKLVLMCQMTTGALKTIEAFNQDIQSRLSLYVYGNPHLTF